jgi:hypothetical protein
MNRSIFRPVVGALVAALALGAVATSALAQSTTIYPANATLTASSVPVTITTPFGNTTCTLNGGKFVVPSSGNASGPVTVNFSTLPTYTECTKIGTAAVSVTTSGTWKLTTQYGTASASVTIPLEGIEIHVATNTGRTTLGDEGPLTFTGAWNNGFTSPINVSTAIQYGGSIRLYWVGAYHETPFSPALQTLSSSSSMALLGP